MVKWYHIGICLAAMSVSSYTYANPSNIWANSNENNEGAINDSSADWYKVSNNSLVSILPVDDPAQTGYQFDWRIMQSSTSNTPNTNNVDGMNASSPLPVSTYGVQDNIVGRFEGANTMDPKDGIFTEAGEIGSGLVNVDVSPENNPLTIPTMGDVNMSLLTNTNQSPIDNMDATPQEAADIINKFNFNR